MKNLEEKIRELPPDDRKEVEQLVEILLKNHQLKSKGKPDFKWAGAAKGLRDQYTSVELQHQISRWRIGEK